MIVSSLSNTIWSGFGVLFFLVKEFKNLWRRIQPALPSKQ